jgi:hypothetical protein
LITLTSTRLFRKLIAETFCEGYDLGLKHAAELADEVASNPASRSSDLMASIRRLRERE